MNHYFPHHRIKSSRFSGNNIGGRNQFLPVQSMLSTSILKNQQDYEMLKKLNTLVDTLKTLKKLISHYFDQISKEGGEFIAGDVRRVYRRILLLYVKYRRRQNHEKRRLNSKKERCQRMGVTGYVDDLDNEIVDDEEDGDVLHLTQATTSTNQPSSSWTMKKIVSVSSIPFTRADFDDKNQGYEDFDEIGFNAMRDVANVQNHCIRRIMNDHQMKLPIYGQKTRWDSEVPKIIKRKPMSTEVQQTSLAGRVKVIKKCGIKQSKNFQLYLTTTPVEMSTTQQQSISTNSHNVSYSPLNVQFADLPTSSDELSNNSCTEQKLFLELVAKNLSDTSWNQLQTIVTSLTTNTNKNTSDNNNNS